MRAALTLAVLIGTAGAACAGSGPVIAIPGRPGVPVIINGVDASYAVVEGDWGLAKGVQVPITVYGGHPVDPGPPVGHYYPSAGHLPGYGRLEIEGADKPKPAQSFHQSWSAGSRQADPPVPLNQVPQYPPPIITAPQFNGRDRQPGSPQNSTIPTPPQQTPAPPQQTPAPSQQTSAPPQQTAPPTQPAIQRAPQHRP